MQSSRPRSASRSGRRSVRIMAGITGLCIVGLVGLWWHLAGGEPVLVVPNPVMPSPNAFDCYTAAGRGVVNTKQIDDPKNAFTGNPITRYRVSKESQGDIVAGVNSP